MSNIRARELALLCVLCVTLACAGCYRPAVGKSGSAGTATVAAPAAPTASPTPIPTASPRPVASPAASATPSASPSAAAVAPSEQMAASVDAALRRPLPYAMAAASPTGTGSRSPPGSRSPSRSPRTKSLSAPQAAGGILGITFDELVFPIEKDQPFDVSLLTDAVRGLFDKKIKIRGYIHPSCPFQNGVTSFILVRDDQSCCFGPGAALYDCVIVDMVPGRTTNFTPKPIAVEGVLTLREFKGLDGKHLAIFHLDAEAVE